VINSDQRTDHDLPEPWSHSASARTQREKVLGSNSNGGSKFAFADGHKIGTNWAQLENDDLPSAPKNFQSQ
jgi:hypothetical protein